MAFFDQPTAEDVFNRVEFDYPVAEQQQVLDILGSVRDQGWHVPWIQLAVLRLACGKVGFIQQWVDLGNADPRDLKLSVVATAGPAWEQDFILYRARRQR
jgi:hypothetical protein